MLGPMRVLPGRLSVTRTFGDLEAKLERLGGKGAVVIAEPEITLFKINSDLDFMIIGSDGVFDKLNNKEIIQGIWAINRNLN